MAREGLASAEALGDRVLAAEFQGRLGLIVAMAGDPHAGIGPLEEAVAVQRKAGARSQLAMNLAALGMAEMLAGDLAASARHHREVLELSSDAGNLVMVGTATVGLAFAASAAGRHVRAARLLGAADRIRREAGGGPVPAILRRIGDPEGVGRRALEVAFDED